MKSFIEIADGAELENDASEGQEVGQVAETDEGGELEVEVNGDLDRDQGDSTVVDSAEPAEGDLVKEQGK